MKNKLKMLFAYFRPLGDIITTEITLDYNRIEDWEETFAVDNKRYVKPPNVIIGVIEELIDLYENDFDKYNDYEVDSWWYLDMVIEPKLNRITFRSQCKVEKYTTESIENNPDDYTGVPELLNKAKEKYGDFTKVYLLIQGRWDSTELIYATADDDDHYHSDLFLEIGDKIMKKNFGKYWHGEQGMEGEITIWGNDVFVDSKNFYEEYEDTGMNLIVRL